MSALPRPWVAISQPNYVPWLGYFDMIHAVDAFILLDTVQYTKRDWRNRNRIKTASGPRWMTIPIRVPLGTPIENVRCADLDWRHRHLSQLQNAYRDAECLHELMPQIVEWYDSLPGTALRDIDEHLMLAVMSVLGVDTPVTRASDLESPDEPTGRLVKLCQQVGARSYVSGPSARSYLDVDRFAEAGIEVGWVNYDYGREYPQPHPPFTRHVSVLDTLLCTGTQARELMIGRSDGFVTPNREAQA